MKHGTTILLIAAAFLFSSCYHAQITTDKAPSNQVIEKEWANSFVYGLVPPPVLETASECPNGLSKVETKISFLNGLVGALTFSLYTPMNIKVTCAASGTAMLDGNLNNRISVDKNASDEEKAKALKRASKQSFDSRDAVYVSFD